MRSFFSEHDAAAAGPAPAAAAATTAAEAAETKADDVACEEILLDAFSR